MAFEYKLVSVSSKGLHMTIEEHFQRKIQYWINSGWELHGGVSVGAMYHGEQFGSSIVYAQGLVKEIK